MTIIQDSNAATTVDKPLRIMGDPQSCEHAKQLVEELLSSRDDFKPRLGFGAGGGKSTGEYGSPQRSLGEVIYLNNSLISQLNGHISSRLLCPSKQLV